MPIPTSAAKAYPHSTSNFKEIVNIGGKYHPQGVRAVTPSTSIEGETASLRSQISNYALFTIIITTGLNPQRKHTFPARPVHHTIIRTDAPAKTISTNNIHQRSQPQAFQQSARSRDGQGIDVQLFTISQRGTKVTHHTTMDRPLARSTGETTPYTHYTLALLLWRHLRLSEGGKEVCYTPLPVDVYREHRWCWRERGSFQLALPPSTVQRDSQTANTGEWSRARLASGAAHWSVAHSSDFMVSCSVRDYRAPRVGDVECVCRWYEPAGLELPEGVLGFPFQYGGTDPLHAPVARALNLAAVNLKTARRTRSFGDKKSPLMSLGRFVSQGYPLTQQTIGAHLSEERGVEWNLSVNHRTPLRGPRQHSALQRNCFSDIVIILRSLRNSARKFGKEAERQEPKEKLQARKRESFLVARDFLRSRRRVANFPASAVVTLAEISKAQRAAAVEELPYRQVTAALKDGAMERAWNIVGSGERGRRAERLKGKACATSSPSTWRREDGQRPAMSRRAASPCRTLLQPGASFIKPESHSPDAHHTTGNIRDQGSGEGVSLSDCVKPKSRWPAGIRTRGEGMCEVGSSEVHAAQQASVTARVRRGAASSSLPELTRNSGVYGGRSAALQTSCPGASEPVRTRGLCQPPHGLKKCPLYREQPIPTLKPRLHQVLQTFVCKFCVEDVCRRHLFTDKILVGSCNKGISILLTAVVKMSSLDDVVLAAAACKQRAPRRYWVRTSLKARARYSGSELLTDLNKDDVDLFSGEVRSDGSLKNFLRMASCGYEHLIVMIGRNIVKQDTKCRAAILVKEKLAVTLRF
ncbi:hypothetical protein PR048_008834 [Dryococelus australis]|uniref:Uncharacterized protein n=1 Tax=Dryococelus australis TaxID=614101 RepID=A0ABQ9HY73_9NEOP|nr:hypothetical protein PR048_008834 [Dryococelus australis]